MRQVADSAAWADQLAGALRHDDLVGEPDDYQRFEDDYRVQISAHYPSFAGPDGTKVTNFPFRRIVVIGRKLG